MSDDVDQDTFYIQYGSTTSRGVFNAGGGGLQKSASEQRYVGRCRHCRPGAASRSRPLRGAAPYAPGKLRAVQLERTMSLLRDFVVVIFGTLAGVGALVLGLLVAAVVWWETPELHVVVNRTNAVMHMEVLGEYPSDIRSVEISDEGRSLPIWRIAAHGEMFQVHSIPVRAGDNPSNIAPEWGASRQEVPNVGASFRLDIGRVYRVKICPSSMFGLCQSTTFTLSSR